MKSITIDPEKCTRDSLCALVCPGQLFDHTDRDAPPVLVPEGPDICTDCGHCVAICPTGALSLDSMTVDECPPIRPELNISTDQAHQFLRSRRSIRNYKDKPVPRELLSRAVELARYGPTGHNSQPVEWLIIENTAEVRRLAGLTADFLRELVTQQPDFAKEMNMDRLLAAYDQGVDRICRNAPHMVVAHAPEENPFAETSASIQLAYLELAALSLGLGACWAGYVNAAGTFYPPMTEALALPAGHKFLGAMMIGFPKYKYQRLPTRKQPMMTWR